MKMIAMTFSFTALLLAGTPAFAKVYKCTDTEGKVYFTDTACPSGNDIKKEEIEIKNSTNFGTASQGYSVMDQYNRMEAERQMEREAAREKRQTAQHSYQNSANRAEADKLLKEARKLYAKGADTNKKLTVAQRRALQDQAASLERQAAMLMGQRSSAAPTATEEMQTKMRRMEDDLDRARMQIKNNPPAHPQYVPSVGKWCQKQGGTVNCW